MTNVSRETTQLQQYAALIRKWNNAINLVAKATLADLEQRHIADSVHLAQISASSEGKWTDLGSGGGLPGVVLAILREEQSFTLLESDKRKSAFLHAAVRELKLPNVSILSSRIEQAVPMNSAHISARALAPLPLLMSYVDRHLAASGTAWLMKGRNWRSEVEEARKTWNFNLQVHPSITDPDAAILEISGIHHA